MALNITINKTAVAASYPAGSTVATAVASGGTTPYTYSIATGGDYFSIDASTGAVTTKALMDASSIQSFSVTATDSNSTPESITSGVVYPNIQAAQQSKFNKSNVIYKIVNDIDLGNAVLTIPTGCTLDFQGGVISNGTIDGEYTKIKAELDKIFENILLVGSFNTDYIAVEWFGASTSLNDNSDYIQSALDNAFTIKANSVRFGTGTYRFSKPLVVRGSSNYVLGEQYNRVLGNGPQSTTLVYTRGSSYKGIYCAIFLESNTHDEGATYNIVLNGFKIMQSNTSAESYGIYSLAGLGCCEISDITMYTMYNGIWFNTDIWQCTLRNLFINGGNTGIHMNRYGTSNVFSRLYMYGQTGTAYYLKGIYQHFENLACDQCTGICYYFLQCQATVDGLGIECPNARVGIIIESYSDLNISSATLLQITRDFDEEEVYNSYIVVNNKSRATFRNSCFGGSYAQTFSGNSNIYAYWVNSYRGSSGENKSYIEFENCRFLGNWDKGIQQPLSNFNASPTIVTHSGNNHTPFNYFNNNNSEPQYPFIGKFDDGNDNINGVNNPDRLNIPPIFFNTHQATPLRDLNGNDVAHFQTVKDALFIPKVKGDYVAFICDEAGGNLLQSKFTPVYKRGYAIGTSDERPPGTADFTSTTRRNACCERFEGQIMYDSTLKKMILFNGTAWVNLDGTPLA
jgi:hypothetical protein